MNPLISVILAVKNGENYLLEALNAIKAQNVDMEIIVIDDGSSDETFQIAKNFGCVMLQNQVSKGFVISRNSGLKIAKGKYVMFHDHDDVMNDNVLTRMLKGFEEAPEFVAMMAQIQDFFSPELPEEEKKKVILRVEPYFGLFSGAILIKKEAFDITGFLNETIEAGDVIDWMDKMEKNNLLIKKLNFIATNRRIHNSNYGRTNKAKQFKDLTTALRLKIKKS